MHAGQLDALLSRPASLMPGLSAVLDTVAGSCAHILWRVMMLLCVRHLSLSKTADQERTAALCSLQTDRCLDARPWSCQISHGAQADVQAGSARAAGLAPADAQLC